jgi:hypothetical protein
MAVEATWHVKLTRRDHSRTAFTDYLNRVPKRGAIITLHIDGERVKPPLQRRLRDIHVAGQHASVQQRHYVSAGKLLLDAPAKDRTERKNTSARIYGWPRSKVG